MAWKCRDCGHIFEEGEQGTIREYHDEVSGGFYEEFMVCPSCESDEIEETIRCKHCSGEFLENELIGGYYCKQCLDEAITLDSFVEFAKDIDSDLEEYDVHTIEHFMMVWFYEVRETGFTYSSKNFRDLMEQEYENEKKASDVYMKFGIRNDLLQKVKEYMKYYNLLDDFAEWLHEKEVEK